MRVSQFIDRLQAHLDCYGDDEVFFLQRDKAYPITYIGAGDGDFSYYWLTTEPHPYIVDGLTELEEQEFKAPAYQAVLKVIK